MKKAPLLLVPLLCMMVSISAAYAGVKPYTKAYEPDTSVALVSTVSWIADKNAVSVSGAAQRPASMFVHLDSALHVFSESGILISDSLDGYISKTADTVIPVLYIHDRETAASLRTYLQRSGLADVFVAAARENAALVKAVADLPYVRGLIDFSDISKATEDELADMAALTNGSRAKVILLCREAASKDNVRYLQSRLMTVWVRTPSNMGSLLDHLTSGVNGIVTEDYAAAYDAISFFQDDAPTLLRIPLIAGHRGMPSMYAENTLLSALGAFSSGADVIENDIWLSADNELFILHDGNLKRLFGRGDGVQTENLTLAELQAVSFDWEGANSVQAKNNQPAAGSRYGFIIGLPSQHIPTLREYLTAFEDSGIVHFTEIKSFQPAIIPVLRALAEGSASRDQLVAISFNTVILDALYAEWPEISAGALGTEGKNFVPGITAYENYTAVADSKGIEKALESLYRVIDRWNASYNPHLSFCYGLAVAGRHRGLTVWPWTYNSPETFADAYRKGVYGLTTNFAWWATDWITDITAKDSVLKPGDKVPEPSVTTRIGQAVRPEGLELLKVSGDAVTDGVAVNLGEALMIYRLKLNLEINGTDYGAYYLYSNPFTVTVKL